MNPELKDSPQQLQATLRSMSETNEKNIAREPFLQLGSLIAFAVLGMSGAVILGTLQGNMGRPPSYFTSGFFLLLSSAALATFRIQLKASTKTRYEPKRLDFLRNFLKEWPGNEQTVLQVGGDWRFMPHRTEHFTSPIKPSYARPQTETDEGYQVERQWAEFEGSWGEVPLNLSISTKTNFVLKSSSRRVDGERVVTTSFSSIEDQITVELQGPQTQLPADPDIGLIEELLEASALQLKASECDGSSSTLRFQSEPLPRVWKGREGYCEDPSFTPVRLAALVEWAVKSSSSQGLRGISRPDKPSTLAT